MKAAIKACHVVYWLALSCWIGAIMTAAIAAMNVFGTLPNLDVRLGEFAGFDPASHGRLAAGMIMERVFWLVDCIQFAAAPLLLVCLIVQLAVVRMPGRKFSNVVRALCIAVAVGTLVYQAIALSPGMNRELRAYWAAAKSGDAEGAAAHRAAFEADHPVAETVFQGRLVLLVVALAASALALSPAAAPMRPLQTPELLGKRDHA